VKPFPGGVLVRSADDEVIRAIGITGDTSDNDEPAAVDAINAARLVAGQRLTVEAGS
jgi:uncharacterized protein GlcG (DUF336 family)